MAKAHKVDKVDISTSQMGQYMAVMAATILVAQSKVDGSVLRRMMVLSQLSAPGQCDIKLVCSQSLQ